MSVVVNDIQLAARKLEELVLLAGSAESAFEKAAAYSATMALVGQFEAIEEELDNYLMENVGRVKWGVAAALGYDIDNGLPASNHLSYARGAVGTIKGLIRDRNL